jgi:hypothetical protein
MGMKKWHIFSSFRVNFYEQYEDMLLKCVYDIEETEK